MVLDAAMQGEPMIFVVDSDEAVGQCDDEDMRKLEALAANKAKNAEQKKEEAGDIEQGNKMACKITTNSFKSSAFAKCLLGSSIAELD